MEAKDDGRLSTSALAKRLKLPIQQLFVTLRDYGWIERRGESWALCAKGEIHGGSYQNSKRYGRYIVWPDDITEHPLLQAIESNQRISPGGMRRYFPHLSARQINRVLAELGLVRFSVQGLELTSLGQRFGGRQDRDEESALLVVSWPHELVDDPVIQREFRRLIIGDVPTTNSEAALEPEATGDLFAQAGSETQVPASAESERAAAVIAAKPYVSIDGHQVHSLLQLRVCEWLYEAGFAHAFRRALPVEESLTADFYVPAARLYIECWEREVPTLELTRRLRLREVCKEMELAYQEVAAADIDRIDELLTQRLRQLGQVC